MLSGSWRAYQNALYYDPMCVHFVDCIQTSGSLITAFGDILVIHEALSGFQKKSTFNFKEYFVSAAAWLVDGIQHSN